VLDGRVREGQINGSISKRQSAAVADEVRKVPTVGWHPKVDYNDPLFPADQVP
jgi:hypothetical protein